MAISGNSGGVGMNLPGLSRWRELPPADQGFPAWRVPDRHGDVAAARQLLQAFARKLYKQADPLAARLMKEAKMDAKFFTGGRTSAGPGVNGAEQVAAVEKALADSLRKVAEDAFTHNAFPGALPGKILAKHLQGNNDLPALLKKSFAEHMRRELAESSAQVISKPGFFQNETVRLLEDQFLKQLQQWQQTALEYFIRHTPRP